MTAEKNFENNYKVYMHINKINNKRYIGITGKNPYKRWANGKGYGGKHFASAIKKYGWNNFEHVLLYQDLTKEEACDLEKELIAKYDSTNPDKGYNRSTGGESPARGARWNLSDETRKKMSLSATGEKNGFYGKHFTEETLKKLREHSKGANNPFYGKKHSPETIEKIKASLRLHYINHNHPNNKGVYCIQKNKLYKNQKSCAQDLNISTSLVSAILRGDRKQIPGLTLERR